MIMSDKSKNPFKGLNKDSSLPAEHKKKVMDSLDTVKLIADIADMFSAKQASADLNLIKNILKKYEG